MTRDYKPSARPRKSPSSGNNGSLLVGILIGLLLGLGIALAVAVYLNKVPGPFVSRSKPAEPTAAKSEPAKGAPATKAAEKAAPTDEKTTRFDFYEILPGKEPANGERKAKETPTPTPAPAADAPPAESKDTFFLQAGAFQSVADADNLKARLALLGIEAAVQAASIPDKGTMHRVRAGPYTRVEDVNRARDTLKQNGIDTTLIKIRDGQ
jgi:cell division protein FtsN